MFTRRTLFRDILLGLVTGLIAWVGLVGVILALGLVRSNESRAAAFADQGSGNVALQPLAELAQATETPLPPPTATPFPRRSVETSGGTVNVIQKFMLDRPVAPNVKGNVPDWYYLYGNTQRGKLAVHHGVEFVNPQGTPLRAVADGTVVVAGGDQEPVCGEGGNELCGAQLDFYGKLVILQLDQVPDGQPVYVLYGHMENVQVKVGQQVKKGQRIGTIGMAGVALGPHLHLEVRYGADTYGDTRNPILWLKPLPGHGSLAGRVLNKKGEPARGAVVYITPPDGEQMFTETYGVDDELPVNGDDDMHENFAMGDLPAGEYQVRVQVGGKEYEETVEIRDGELQFVVLGGQ